MTTLMVLLDLKSTLSNGFNNYVLPLVGASWAVAFVIFAIRNAAEFKEDFMAALIKTGAFSLLGAVVGVMLVAVVEQFKNLKVTF